MTEMAMRIVNALRVECGERTCTACPCDDWCSGREVNCLENDAADLIESLSAQLDQVTRERDAAVKGLARYRGCIDCARYDEEIVKTNPLCDGCSFGSKWQLRGVEVEG